MSFAPGPGREHRKAVEMAAGQIDPRTEARQLAGLGLCRDKPCPAKNCRLTSTNSAWPQARA